MYRQCVVLWHKARWKQRLVLGLVRLLGWLKLPLSAVQLHKNKENLTACKHLSTKKESSLHLKKELPMSYLHQLSTEQLSLALLCLSEELKPLPEELKHLSHLDWLLLSNLLENLLLEQQYSQVH